MCGSKDMYIVCRNMSVIPGHIKGGGGEMCFISLQRD